MTLITHDSDSVAPRHGSDMVAMRHAMVASQLRTNAVSDARVVAAMDSVAREAFLPAEVAALAYRDTAVPLGHGRAQNVPIATGRLLTQAELRASDRVLLIGAAGGYTAAVLAHLVDSVVALECEPALAAHARTALGDAANVTVVEGPLEAGHSAGAPYDVLVIDGSVEAVPEALVAQVAIGGRVVAGIVDRGVTRLTAGRRTAGGFALLDFADIDCVALPGFARPRTFTF
ncbi:protein-L-isoaspartate O-methyltransferase [Sphingomonas sp. RB3P16]|uniref:protein-L-isoaspartate O-methyltransferase family protein n=1 Tax=Parasphingomonas frigoris TaxID=3096163 RepID=UPI002FC9B186